MVGAVPGSDRMVVTQGKEAAGIPAVEGAFPLWPMALRSKTQDSTGWKEICSQVISTCLVLFLRLRFWNKFYFLFWKVLKQLNPSRRGSIVIGFALDKRERKKLCVAHICFRRNTASISIISYVEKKPCYKCNLREDISWGITAPYLIKFI